MLGYGDFRGPTVPRLMASARCGTPGAGLYWKLNWVSSLTMISRISMCAKFIPMQLRGLYLPTN